jgi:hypothetical protein
VEIHGTNSAILPKNDGIAEEQITLVRYANGYLAGNITRYIYIREGMQYVKEYYPNKHAKPFVYCC